MLHKIFKVYKISVLWHFLDRITNNLERRVKKMRTVHSDSLGVCEHCGHIFPARDVVKEGEDGKCPKCNKEISAATFGYRKFRKKWRKNRWLGPDGKWIDTEPSENFSIGELYIIVSKREYH